MSKVHQQKFILRLTLYILRENGFMAPKKRQVLNFIKFRNLMLITADEAEKRYHEDHDDIWENDIAWKRKDLFEDGSIDSPERGKWRLTTKGVRRVDEKKVGWLMFENFEERRKFLEDFDYLTDDTIDWMLKIARGKSLALKKY